MVTRGSIIVALLVVEFAIAGTAAVAIRGNSNAPARTRPASAAAERQDAALVEGGPPQSLAVSDEPAVSVDIGYADLTIVAGTPGRIDASVSPSTDFGIMRSTAPIRVRRNGDTIRIARSGDRGWSVGDDRRVTLVVPPQTRVTVVNAGDVDVRGLRAEAAITSVGHGSITVEDYAAPALHAIARGRIALRDVATPHLDVASSESRVDATMLSVHDGSIESDERMTLAFAKGTDTLVTADATSGRIIVSGLTAASAPIVDSRTDDDGDKTSSSLQSVRVGAGNGHLDVRSHDGNIDLASEK
jgi:hypothetical protein